MTCESSVILCKKRAHKFDGVRMQKNNLNETRARLFAFDRSLFFKFMSRFHHAEPMLLRMRNEGEEGEG